MQPMWGTKNKGKIQLLTKPKNIRKYMKILKLLKSLLSFETSSSSAHASWLEACIKGIFRTKSKGTLRGC